MWWVRTRYRFALIDEVHTAMLVVDAAPALASN
jgi:hypothetical protein